MNESQRKHLEDRLQEERRRTVRALEKSELVQDDGELSNYSQHPADEGSDTMEREKTLMLLSQEGQRLTEIDRALRRLYKEPDRFGRCENCGNEISMERLELVPWATRCKNCQSEREVG